LLIVWHSFHRHNRALREGEENLSLPEARLGITRGAPPRVTVLFNDWPKYYLYTGKASAQDVGLN
jgi:hypothetical protein